MPDTQAPRWPSAAIRDTVRAALDAADFREEALRRLFSVDSVYRLSRAAAHLLARQASGDSPLEVLARLFLLGLEVSPALAGRSLGAASVSAMQACGLLSEQAGLLRANVHLMPADGVLIAFDRRERHFERHADFVLGPGPSSRWVAGIAIRRPVGSTLDLGCGSGYLACLAARHSGRVTAADLTPRAVAFSEFNAALNGLDNVECLQGDLYAPAAGRRFDLVICNAPYVVSPATTFVYRDGAPGLCARIVREAPQHLAPDGVLQMSCNWPIRHGRDAQAELAAWFEGTGCDAWVLRSETHEATRYAMLWLDREQKSEQAQAAELDQWLDFYQREGIEAIGSGTVMARTARGRTPVFEMRDSPAFDMEGGETIARGLAAREFLARIESDADLLDARLLPSPDIEQHLRQRTTGDGWKRAALELRLTRGLRFAARVDPVAAAIIGLMDGRRSLRDAAELVAGAAGIPEQALLGGLPALARRLLELCLLLPPSTSGDAGAS